MVENGRLSSAVSDLIVSTGALELFVIRGCRERASNAAGKGSVYLRGLPDPRIAIAL